MGNNTNSILPIGSGLIGSAIKKVSGQLGIDKASQENAALFGEAAALGLSTAVGGPLGATYFKLNNSAALQGIAKTLSAWASSERDTKAVGTKGGVNADDLARPGPAVDVSHLPVDNEAIGNRVDYNTWQGFAKTKEGAQRFQDIAKSGIFVGDTYVKNGFLKNFDFTKLDKSFSAKVGDKDLKLDKKGLEELTKAITDSKDGKVKFQNQEFAKTDLEAALKDNKNYSFGKSGLSPDQFVRAAARAGFTAKDENALDASLTKAKDALGTNPLAKDGATLGFLVANSRNKDGSVDATRLKGLAEELNKKDSTLQKMINQGNATANDPKLKSVKEGDRNKTAQDYNSKQFAETAGDKAGAQKDTLKQYGVADTNMTQFSGAAYSTGARDMGKLGDKEFIGKATELAAAAKEGKNPFAINIRLNVGSNAADAKGVYADAARGHEFAVGSELTEKLGLKAGELNQLNLTVHGEQGMKGALEQIQKFKEATGAQINLDMGIYGHSTQDGQMHLGADATSGKQESILNKQDAQNLMGQVKGIVGDTGSAHITTWGCNTNSLVDALHSEGQKAGIGNLDVTGTSKLAESSASNLASSDTLQAYKLGADGQVRSDSTTTNGLGNDTYQKTVIGKAYQDLAAENKIDLKSQEQSEALGNTDDARKQSQQLNQQLRPQNQGGAADDGKDGDGNVAYRDQNQEDNKDPWARAGAQTQAASSLA